MNRIRMSNNTRKMGNIIFSLFCRVNIIELIHIEWNFILFQPITNKLNH